MKSRASWATDRTEMARALEQIARESGKGSTLYKCMGSMAWGRYEGEPCATDSKDNTVFGCGYLNGTRDALLRVARVLGWPEATLLEEIHRRMPSHKTFYKHVDFERDGQP